MGPQPETTREKRRHRSADPPTRADLIAAAAEVCRIVAADPDVFTARARIAAARRTQFGHPAALSQRVHSSPFGACPEAIPATP